MIHCILSPAKKLNEKMPQRAISVPELQQYSQQLVACLQQYSWHQLASLMSISDRLALLNAERFSVMRFPIGRTEPHYAALDLFNGEAYAGLEHASLNKKAQQYLQQNLSILSGLYGLLRPGDAIYPYRLEMGTRLKVGQHQDLYQFWGVLISTHLQQKMQQTAATHLVNLASNEYFRAIQATEFPYPIITPVFRDWHQGQYKTIVVYAKRARGMMVRYAAEHQLTQVEDLKNFDSAGYAFQSALSTEKEWVFTREKTKYDDSTSN